MPSKVKTLSIRLPESLQEALQRHVSKRNSKHGLIVAAIAQSVESWSEPGKLDQAYEALDRLTRTTPSVPPPPFIPSVVEDESGGVPLVPSLPMPVSLPVSFEDEPTSAPVDISLPAPASDMPKGPPSTTDDLDWVKNYDFGN